MSRTVAIVGRPNVGKSTLFNRLTGRRQALVDDQPGVTRDRREGEARLGHLSFRVVDTAGLEDSAPETIAGRASAQTLAAVSGADAILFMVDARAGITPTDRAFAELVRRSGRPVVIVANKAEGRGGEVAAMEAFSLGFGEPVALSAEHGDGLGALVAALAPLVDEQEPAPAEVPADPAGPPAPVHPLRIAVTGRPNAGKSTLVNRLVGADRVLTGPEPGITRDAIEVTWEWRGRPMVLVDTAGLRRKARIVDPVEKMAVSDAIRAVGFAEVVVLVIDADASFDAQDAQIGDLVLREGRALIIAADKWDLVEDRREKLKEMREKAEEVLPQARGIPIVPISGLTGFGLDALMEAIVATHKLWNARIPTAQLNRWLAAHVEAHAPPASKGRRPRFRYMTQPKARPPTFAVFCSQPQAVPDSYVRYMVNGLRDTFGLDGIPIRLSLRRTGDNPFASKAGKKP